MYKQLFVFGSRLLGLNHVWQLSGQAFWEELAEKPAIAAEPSAKMRRDFAIHHHDYLDIMAPRRCDIKTTTDIGLYLHGGGFIEPITAYHWHFISDIVMNTNMPVAVLDYPLVPNANLDDIYERMQDAIWELHHDFPEANISLIGDSSGPQLALGYTQLIEALPIKKIVAISPMVDMTLSNPDIKTIAKRDPVLSLPAMPDVIKVISEHHSLQDAVVSPLYGNFDNQHILLISGTRDLTNPDNRLFATKFAANVTYIEGEGLPHAYPIWPLTRNTSVKRDIYDFLMGHTDEI